MKKHLISVLLMLVFCTLLVGSLTACYTTSAGIKFEEGSEEIFPNCSQDIYTIVGYKKNISSNIKIYCHHNNGFVAEVGEKAFENCDKLKSVVIYPGLCRINDYAFKNCVNLENITLPQTLGYLGKGVFDDCEKLKTINFLGIKVQWTDLTKNGDYSHFKIICADGIIE